MCLALQKLRDSLVCSSPSSQLDASSGEKEEWCFSPTPQHKNLPRLLCVSSPCLEQRKAFPEHVNLAARVGVSGDRWSPRGLVPAVRLKDSQEAELNELLGLNIFHFPK